MLRMEVEHYVGLAKRVALNVARTNRRYTLDELMEWAMEGLGRAARYYREDTGYQFSTYAYKVIRTWMVECIRREDRSRKREVPLLDGKIPGTESLTRAEVLPDRAPGPEARLMMRERSATLRRALEGLTEKERSSVIRYYGLGRAPMTLESIARLEGVSRQNIYGRLCRAREKMVALIKEENSL